MFNLKDKHILVTGASSGIGLACARQLSEYGATVTLLARDTERLEAVSASLHGPSFVIAHDLLDDTPLAEVLSEAVAKHGGFDGLVHAAGMHSTVPLRALSVSHWEQIFSVNVTSAMRLIKALRARGVAKSGASYVLLGSVMSVVGQPASTAYSASKSALVGLTKSLALELAKDCVRVNLVCPGMVLTEMQGDFVERVGEKAAMKVKEMHPLGLGRPEDVAAMVHYLIADAARWVTGSILMIDGGYSAA